MHQDQIAQALLLLAAEFKESREQRKTEFEWFKSHLNCVTQQDLKAMESRLLEAIARAGVPASIEAAVLRVQSGLDQLDATIPDRQT